MGESKRILSAIK